MRNQKHFKSATPQSVWVAFREYERLLIKSKKEFDQRMKERDERVEKDRLDYERRMKNYEKTMGSWANNHGEFAEEYFFNSFEDGKTNFFGEKFDDIKKGVRGLKIDDEYDILLINGKSVGIIEVKFKARESDIPKVLRKAQTFRINYPDFENHQVYLGLATLSFYDELEDECKKQGIAIIKQIGDTMVINDEHLKVF